ncbi:hypothetical protein LR48_Vigan11g077400 [Vigna angularis]|uniref:Uncharacterized protein n=1 Tax=Phaseolus angularis TaxID=3914 RepID=A0A0L9VRN3_PHAAN|nr:hypothetical protein LR48_Vigan11g077400 [Vigna angularis]
MFHVGSAHSNDNDSDFESEPIEVKYNLLLDAFQEIHAEAMRLQSKVGVPKGKYKWILKGQPPASNHKGPKFVWVATSKPLNHFVGNWKKRKLISHKYLKLSFFRNEGFVFQSWLSKQGLKMFNEMTNPWYLELVRVFYSNLKISDGTLCSRVKGVDIKLTNEVWTDIAGFRLEGQKCHLGMEGFHKFTIYQDSLRNIDEVRDYSHYKTGGMKKDDKLFVFVISWILMSRGSNHAQATTEDLYLLKAIKENIQVDWPAAISENTLKHEIDYNEVLID